MIDTINKEAIGEFLSDPEVATMLDSLEKETDPDNFYITFIEIRSKFYNFSTKLLMGQWPYFLNILCEFYPNILEHMNKIPALMYYDCDWLTEIEIPSNVVEIRVNAFKKCKNLTKVKLPKSLVKVEEAIFTDCKELAYIEFDGTTEEWNEMISMFDTNWAYGLPFNIPVYCTDGRLFGVYDISL